MFAGGGRQFAHRGRGGGTVMDLIFLAEASRAVQSSTRWESGASFCGKRHHRGCHHPTIITAASSSLPAVAVASRVITILHES